MPELFRNLFELNTALEEGRVSPQLAEQERRRLESEMVRLRPGQLVDPDSRSVVDVPNELTTQGPGIIAGPAGPASQLLTALPGQTGQGPPLPELAPIPQVRTTGITPSLPQLPEAATRLPPPTPSDQPDGEHQGVLPPRVRGPTGADLDDLARQERALQERDLKRFDRRGSLLEEQERDTLAQIDKEARDKFRQDVLAERSRQLQEADATETRFRLNQDYERFIARQEEIRKQLLDMPIPRQSKLGGVLGIILGIATKNPGAVVGAFNSLHAQQMEAVQAGASKAQMIAGLDAQTWDRTLNFYRGDRELAEGAIRIGQLDRTIKRIDEKALEFRSNEVKRNAEAARIVLEAERDKSIAGYLGLARTRAEKDALARAPLLGERDAVTNPGEIGRRIDKATELGVISKEAAKRGYNALDSLSETEGLKERLEGIEGRASDLVDTFGGGKGSLKVLLPKSDEAQELEQINALILETVIALAKREPNSQKVQNELFKGSRLDPKFDNPDSVRLKLDGLKRRVDAQRRKSLSTLDRLNVVTGARARSGFTAEE